MKTVILAGGLGTRLSEETDKIPKPMVTIGGIPILVHIMRHYSHYGFNEFIICCGYKGYMIKEYFEHYFLHKSDVTFDLSNNKKAIHSCNAEKWKITLVDTGENTLTGARIKQIEKYIEDDTFMLTYGDGVSDVKINKILAFHQKHDSIVTLTASQPSSRFGTLNIDNSNTVKKFTEKPKNSDTWINSGFMVCDAPLFENIHGNVMLEDVLSELAEIKEVKAFRHYGKFNPMDTIRDRNYLEELWKNNKAFWRF